MNSKLVSDLLNIQTSKKNTYKIRVVYDKYRI